MNDFCREIRKNASPTPMNMKGNAVLAFMRPINAPTGKTTSRVPAIIAPTR
jgi:hypothetical protein